VVLVFVLLILVPLTLFLKIGAPVDKEAYLE